MANQLRMWGPAAVWAAVLFLLSAWPNPVGPDWLALNDKAVHTALFAVLGACLGLGRRLSRQPARHALVVGIGALYGGLDEWHQSLVPGRTPSLGDWVADVIGVILGYVLILFLMKHAGESVGVGERAD